jgi:hypothetical protein
MYNVRPFGIVIMNSPENEYVLIKMEKKLNKNTAN